MDIMAENDIITKKENSVTCRIRVQAHNADTEMHTLHPRDMPDIMAITRKSWVTGLQDYVTGLPSHLEIRALDFQLSISGSVSVSPQPMSPVPPLVTIHPSVYPSAYRIPPETISGLAAEEKVRRAELFALGSLIYEIYADEAPFASLLEQDIQAQFRQAHFPNVTHLFRWPIILSCWSVEFARAIGGKYLFQALGLPPAFPLPTAHDNDSLTPAFPPPFLEQPTPRNRLQAMARPSPRTRCVSGSKSPALWPSWWCSPL